MDFNSIEDAKRFWSKVSIPKDFIKDCWLWTAGLCKAGYGQFRVGGRKGSNRKSHQISYELMHGKKVEKGLELDHLCRNRACLNPYHLEAVTHKENCNRGIRWNGKTCKRGHLWEEGNTIYLAKGRMCRICKNEWKRMDYKNKKKG